MAKKTPIICPASRLAFRRWLAANHHLKDSHRVQLFKKNSPDFNLSAREVTEECLCFGWIDSVPMKGTDEYYFLLISPRKPSSAWSALNKRLVKKLLDSKRMRPPGQKAIAIAKTNGTWDALEKSDRLLLPKELKLLLGESKQAKEFFEALSPSSKRIILEWIYAAKKIETQKQRIHKTVELAKLGLRANHYRDLQKLKTSK